jgi:predicted ABC-type ATPase
MLIKAIEKNVFIFALMQKELFVIAGCNGAGKTTASFSLLPSILNCDEFVNADEIAKGISPFHPDQVSIEAGRIMLSRIQELKQKGVNFAFETTLASRSFVNVIESCKKDGYSVTLLYFWLSSPELAIKRVHERVKDGGHNIPEEVIRRRYFKGLKNLFNLYQNKCDLVLIFDNSDRISELLYEKSTNSKEFIYNDLKFQAIISIVK